MHHNGTKKSVWIGEYGGEQTTEQATSRPACDALQGDIILGKRLGTGGFGTVFKGELKEEGGKRTPIIIKKVRICLRVPHAH